MTAFFLRLCRITALVAWFLFIALISIPFHFAGQKGMKIITRISRLWSRGVAKIINLRVKTFGRIHADTAGMVVSNHKSYLDIIAQGSICLLRYSPKSEIARWPFIGWFIALSHPIWINRQSPHASEKITKEFAETIKRGTSVIVYPEGTSSGEKRGILPFKSSPFEAVCAENLPVFPVLTRYREIPGRPTVCWYGDMTLLPHVWQVLGFSFIEVELRFLPPVFPEGRTRKELANHVHELLEREMVK